MSSHSKGSPIHGGFCITHLRCVLACADGEITRALALLPAADLKRLRRLVAKPVEGEVNAPERKEAV